MASILQYMRTDSPATVPPSSDNDTHALVFRCHDPTPAALRRIGEAADQLQACRVAVWVSLDTTHIPEEPPSLLPILQHSSEEEVGGPNIGRPSEMYGGRSLLILPEAPFKYTSTTKVI